MNVWLLRAENWPRSQWLRPRHELEVSLLPLAFSLSYRVPLLVHIAHCRCSYILTRTALCVCTTALQHCGSEGQTECRIQMIHCMQSVHLRVVGHTDAFRVLCFIPSWLPVCVLWVLQPEVLQKIWTHTNSWLRNHDIHHEYTQHVSMGTCRFSQYTWLICTWVLPTTTTTHGLTRGDVDFFYG